MSAGPVGEALDRLNEALVAAERRIFEMDFGVRASVQIPSSDWELSWEKFDKRWGLAINKAPITQAPRGARIVAPYHLEALVEHLRLMSSEEYRAIDEAIQTAQAFARGEYDGAEVP